MALFLHLPLMRIDQPMIKARLVLRLSVAEGQKLKPQTDRRIATRLLCFSQWWLHWFQPVSLLKSFVHSDILNSTRLVELSLSLWTRLNSLGWLPVSSSVSTRLKMSQQHGSSSNPFLASDFFHVVNVNVKAFNAWRDRMRTRH